MFFICIMWNENFDNFESAQNSMRLKENNKKSNAFTQKYNIFDIILYNFTGNNSRLCYSYLGWLKNSSKLHSMTMRNQNFHSWYFNNVKLSFTNKWQKIDPISAQGSTKEILTRVKILIWWDFSWS